MDTIREQDARIALLEKGLNLYAEGDHFIHVEETTFDNVSGEGENWYQNDAGDMIEDGTLAKRILAGENVEFEY